MLNLDTHILIETLENRISEKEIKLLSRSRWSCSSVVLWEIAMLIRKNKLKMSLENTKFRRLVATMQIWPITLEICQAVNQLDFQSDPADEIIAATSIVHDLPLMTRDQKILKSKMVPLV